jgi:apolipoprotein N-acyltransferase
VTAPLIAAVAVSAAAFVLAFPPYDLGVLAWVSLIPLVAAVWRRSPRGAFWTGYAWGLLAFGGVLWWLTGFGILAWMFAAALVALAPAIALGAAAWAGTGNARRAVLWIPLTWTAVEWLRGQGSLGIPWALLGESQHAALAVSQIASLTGVYGVTFLVALANAVGCLLLARSAGPVPVAATAAVLAAAIFYGSTELAAPVRADTTVALVQPAFQARMTWNPAQAARDLATLNALTHDAAGATLVVWPETASPVDISGDPRMRAVVGGWVRRDHVTLIASSLEGGLTNSAFSVAPDGVIVGRYDKQRLVPFAEAGEQPGRGPAVLPTPAGGLGLAICFESTFPDHARRAVLDGAALLAVLTNDAWFDGRAAPLQHAAIAPFRAIEAGRFLLRAANAGPSEIIDPHGRVVASLPLGARGVLTGRVAPRTGLTWYARYGDILPWAAVLASALAVAPSVARLAVADGRRPAFARLLVASAVPPAALFLASAFHVVQPVLAGAPVPLPPLAVLIAAALLSRGRPAAEIGFGRGFAPAAAASLAIVAVLVWIAARAFTAHGGAMPVTPPPGGWWPGIVPQVLIVGLGFEWWLRGIVFAAAAAWRGPVWAVGWSAVLGAAAGVPRGPEAALWGLAGGAAFGIVRMRWASVPALALAHGIGAALLGFLFRPF